MIVTFTEQKPLDTGDILVTYKEIPLNKGGYTLIERGYFLVNPEREIIQWKFFTADVRKDAEEAGYKFTHVDSYPRRTEEQIWEEQ